MVSEKIKDDKTYYLCDICKFAYETRELAQKCEDFCKEHNACSVDITKHAVKI